MEARFPLLMREEISPGARLPPGSDDVFASKWREDLIYQISMFLRCIFLQALRQATTCDTPHLEKGAQANGRSRDGCELQSNAYL